MFSVKYPTLKTHETVLRYNTKLKRYIVDLFGEITCFNKTFSVPIPSAFKISSIVCTFPHKTRY